MKNPSSELINEIHQFMHRHKGRLYTPIPHPAFAGLPYRNGPERFDLIAPHLEYVNGTVLDIGSNWGYMAHRLEERGYTVTAVECSPRSVYFLREIRDLCGRKFEIVHDSIFNIGRLEYDIVLALNIFHHFMKTEESFAQWDRFLGKLNCRMMIYQAHDPSEGQMAGAYRNMTPEEAAQYLSKKLSLPHVVEIGRYRRITSFRRMVKSYLKGKGSAAERRLFKLSAGSETIAAASRACAGSSRAYVRR